MLESGKGEVIESDMQNLRNGNHAELGNGVLSICNYQSVLQRADRLRSVLWLNGHGPINGLQ